MKDYTVFQCLAVQLPTKKEKKDGASPEILGGVELIVASDAQKAGMKFMTMKAKGWEDLCIDIENIDLVIRPFLTSPDEMKQGNSFV